MKNTEGANLIVGQTESRKFGKLQCSCFAKLGLKIIYLEDYKIYDFPNLTQKTQFWRNIKFIIFQI